MVKKPVVPAPKPATSSESSDLVLTIRLGRATAHALAEAGAEQGLDELGYARKVLRDTLVRSGHLALEDAE